MTEKIPPVLALIDTLTWEGRLKDRKVFRKEEIIQLIKEFMGDQRDADAAWYKTHWTKEQIEGAKLAASASKVLCESRIQQAKNKLLDWAIGRRQKLQGQKSGQGYSKPADIQAQQVLGGKIKAFQEMIDKLRSMQ